MKFQLQNSSLKIIYSFVILSFYFSLVFILTNSLFAFILTMNVFYFSRELLYKKLFSSKTNVLKNIIPLPQLQKTDAEILPDSIKSIMRSTLLSSEPIRSKISQITPSMNQVNDNSLLEEKLLSEFQKAEELIEKKIQELQAKKHIKKEEIEQKQEEIKQELILEIPALETHEVWDTWKPALLDDKLLSQSIYCVKCQKLLAVKDMEYELLHTTDYYEIKTLHTTENEDHINHTRFTPATYEILSKPILTVQPKEVLA